MIRNFLRVALRNITRSKLMSAINILSLAFGIAACILIFLFIHDERSFDSFHARSDQIYRLDEVQSFPGTNTQRVALSMPGMGPNLNKDYPEVSMFTRFWGRGNRLLYRDDFRILVESVVSVDSNFLEIFDFPMLAGDQSTALDDPYSILLTETVSTAFFGEEDPLGQTLTLNDQPYTVTGLLEDVPENSHLQFDVLISLTTQTRSDPNWNMQFGSNYLVTYLLMDRDTDIRSFEAKMPEFLARYMPPNEGYNVNDYYRLFLQPLSEVHLASMDIEHDYQNFRKFNGKYLDIFVMVGIFILLIAGMNFMNLITARASHRWKEVGVRKTVGARKSQLFTQFAVESVLMGLISFVLAVLIAIAATPLVNDMIGRELSLTFFIHNPSWIALALMATLLLGFFAGIYPSLYLASHKVVNILRGGNRGYQKSVFRSGLVVFQFGLAIAMIVSTLVVARQIHFMNNADVGFDKDQIIVVDMNQTANNRFETIKTELLANPNIAGVTASGQRIGNNFHQWGFKFRTDSMVSLTPSNLNVDFDYLKVYDIGLKEGRDFSKERPRDREFAFIINEAFANDLNLAEPVGMAAGHSWYEDDSLGTIIGIAEDFNFNSLHYDINTLVLSVHPEWGYNEMSVKINGTQVEAAIAGIEEIWNRHVPDWPFQYHFLDEHFAELYRSDSQMESVMMMMAGLAILVACMGLFGLAAITTERKVKEIGIRKVLGASVPNIMVYLSRNFGLLVVIAFVLFSPFTYFFMNNWLDGFAYRVSIHPLFFLLGGIIAFLIAMATVSYHTWRTARTNPVKSLRYE